MQIGLRLESLADLCTLAYGTNAPHIVKANVHEVGEAAKRLDPETSPSRG
jgi:hypothetical protein